MGADERMLSCSFNVIDFLMIFLVGWVYTNDAWLEPRVAPSEEWKVVGGMTRRRRWTRRIYLNPISV